MEWYHVLATLLGNAALVFPLWLWQRTESRTDARHFDVQTKELRRELIDVVRSMAEESKDFHGRLERQDAEFKQRFLALEVKRSNNK